MTNVETRYNLERLEKLRAEIEFEARLGKHDQSTWGIFFGKVTEKFKWPGGTRDGGQWAAVSCPTSACAAGWTTIGAGAKMLVAVGLNSDEARGSASHVVTKDGVVRDISEYAAELLGLDEYEQSRLFSGDPTTEETLYNIDELICAAKHGRTWYEQRRLNGGSGLRDGYLSDGPMVEAVDNT